MKRITVAALLSLAFCVWGCDREPCPVGVCHVDEVDHSIIATFQQECSNCHQWQRVYSVSFSSVDRAWSLVDHMIDNGADLAQEDVMALAAYLYELTGSGG